MIVLTLSYKVPPEEILAHRAAHLDWLRAAADEGRLLFAGRKQPVTGGMIAVTGTVEEARAWAATDPFALHGLADYDIAEIEVSVTAPGLEALKA